MLHVILKVNTQLNILDVYNPHENLYQNFLQNLEIILARLDKKYYYYYCLF